MNEPAKKKTLNDLVEEYRELLWHIEDNDGVVESEWFMQMNQLDEDLANKIDRCLWVVDEFEAQAERYKKRADALAKHAKTLKARGKSLKEYVKNSMEIIGAKKLSTENYSSVLVAKSPPSVHILDEDRFIDMYRDTELVKVKYSPNKTAIKEELKEQMSMDDEPLRYAELITDKTTLRYK